MKKYSEKIRKIHRKKICAGVSFSGKLLALLTEALTQVFSSEFCEFFKNSYFAEHILMTAIVRALKIITVDFE